MMIKSILVLTVTLLLPVFLVAQSIEKAQKMMDKFNYVEAIDILKHAAANPETRNKAIPMLAECYRLQHDIANTKAMYARAITLPETKPEYFYYYALALRSTGDYIKAHDMFIRYADMNPTDPRGKLFASHCDSVLGPWKGRKGSYQIKRVNSINSSQSEFGPAIFEGKLVFASDFSRDKGEGQQFGWTGRGFLNIMKATPVVAGNFWGYMGSATEFERKFNQAQHDGPASFSRDGNIIFFTRSFYGKTKREGEAKKTNMLKIFYSTRTDGEWGEVKPFFLNSDEYSVGHPCLSRDEKTLYFVSNMPGGQGGADLWMCRSNGDGWEQPVNLGPKVNTTEDEMFPTMRDDGTLFFASDGHAGYGSLDMFKTRYVNGNWTTPVNLHPPFNGSYDDFAIAFASSNDTGFFSSNRPGGGGNDDIYAFRTIKAPSPASLPAFINGVVRNKITMLPIAGATVFLLNHSTGMVKILKTNTAGIYKTVVSNPADYTAKAMIPKHITDCFPFSISQVVPGTTYDVPRDLLLDEMVINKTYRLNNIYYDYGKSDIRDDVRSELDKLVKIMDENPIKAELGSHTDSRGKAEFNNKLSQDRADAAVNYIIHAGIDRNRITAKGYGESLLTNNCADGVECTEEEHQANQRTEFKITGFVTTAANSKDDLDKYHAGQEIPLHKFESSFFADCNNNSQWLIVNAVSETTTFISTKKTKKQAIVEVPEIEDKITSCKVVENPEAIVYRVNLFSLSKEKSINDPLFNGLDNIMMYVEDERYKYAAGKFDSQQAASDYQKKLIKVGFEGAFIVAFKNGKRISLNKVITESNSIY